MRIISSPRLGAMAVSAVATVSLAAACGGTGGSDAARDSASADSAGGSVHSSSASPNASTSTGVPSVTPAASGSKVLTREELNGVLLGEHELPGYDIGYVGERKGPGHVVPPAQLPHVTPAHCQAVYEATAGLSAYPYSAAVSESAVPTGTADHQGVMFTLLSYTPATAPKVLKDVRSALPACATSTLHPSGDAFSDSPDLARPHAVADPRLGDESVAFRVTEVHPADDTSGAVSLDMHVLLVRKGATVLVFTADSSAEPGKPAAMPTAVVTAQLDKLH
jgi:hypothetical protein